MSQWWAVPMLTSGGLFVGGVISIAWERVPAWRATDFLDFRTGFAHTLRRVDRIQPALLVVCLLSTIGFAVNAGGAARTLAVLAAGGFLVVLVGSAALLVPIQRRLVASGPEAPSVDLVELRTRWLRGHLVRTAVALGFFVLAVVATVV
jgi:anthrone oxygenase-like protein